MHLRAGPAGSCLGIDIWLLAAKADVRFDIFLPYACLAAYVAGMFIKLCVPGLQGRRLLLGLRPPYTWAHGTHQGPDHNGLRPIVAVELQQATGKTVRLFHGCGRPTRAPKDTNAGTRPEPLHLHMVPGDQGVPELIQAGLNSAREKLPLAGANSVAYLGGNERLNDVGCV